MKAPRLETRRAPEFAAELRERARAWLPSWALSDGDRDFGHALLDIAARFSSEVAERLDRAGEKMQRGFLDWLAIRPEAARPARMPVVFKLAETAKTPVDAPSLVRMQIDAAGANVIFETETEVRLIPGNVDVVVGVDADKDAIYLPPPGLSDLEPLEPLPVQWQLKSFAPVDATLLQVDPEAGLAADFVVEAAGQQYRIVKADKEIITIDPPLSSELPALTVLRKVAAFAPFDGKTRNRQEHAVYLGDETLLDLESAATIALAGAQSLREGVTWQYWGKVGLEEEAGWRTLKPAPDDKQQSGALVLTKPKGAVEPTEIAGKSSRWIRGITRNVPATQQPFQTDELSLGINPFECDDPKAFPPIAELPPIEAEGMANTQPLVLESVFYPLGREPRQFDAFYVGSPEAFSKPGARVQLHFEMGDPSFESLAYLRSGVGTHSTLAGVGGDGHLYLLALNGGQLTRDNRGPLRPPSPGPNGAANDEPPILLESRPAYRPAMWWEETSPITGNTNIAVATADTVWMWRNVWPSVTASGWHNLGVVGPVSVSAAKIAGIVHLEDGLKGRLFALRDGKLFRRNLNDANATWTAFETKDNANVTVKLQTIVPILLEQGGDVVPGTVAEGLIGVGDNERLYAVTDLLSDPATCTELLVDVAIGIAPAAVRRSNDRLIAVAVHKDLNGLRAFRSTAAAGSFVLDDDDDQPVDVQGFIGHSIDVNRNSGVLTFALTVQDAAQSSALVLWTPFVPPLPLISTIPSGVGIAGGAPALLPAYVIVPAESSQLMVSPFSVGDVLQFQTVLETAIVAKTAADQLQASDQIAIPISETAGEIDYQLEAVIPPAVTTGGETLYPFHFPSVDADVYVARAPATNLHGDVDANDFELLTLDAAHGPISTDTFLLITSDVPSTRVHRIDVIVDANLGIVRLDRNIDIADPNNPVDYRIVEPSAADLRPLMNLTPANNNWSVSLLDRTYLAFPDGVPQRQRGKAFTDDGSGHPLLVVLQAPWTTAPADPADDPVTFLVDATVGEWSAQLGDPSSNPALSWEYANGTGWWKLDPIEDQTLNLKRTGNVWFAVPADLRPMDWAGRTNHWIRARLIGGDYGKEIVTVKNILGGQAIERSTAGLRPPLVLTLNVAYKLCTTTRPAFVLAKDSGSMRDQSEANRTRGAIVEAFVPLAVALGRLSGAAATADAQPDPCPLPCGCPGESEDRRPPAGSRPAAGGTASSTSVGRALFIGLKASPSGVPVNVLLLVDKESPHEQFAPMKIDALVADRFVPIVANDTTRALGESGLLSMAFAVEPTPRELFGRENLTWLRLTPGGSAATDQWTPSLRGAYLNAVWASAAETLTRELLGSSQGAPNLTVFLARPPVLRDSLELRVREPLGEEERNALREHDETRQWSGGRQPAEIQRAEARRSTRVLSDVEGLPGHWVLWDRVTDPGDEEPGARVYALDEADGEIRFGDGQHGMIPPIGRDSIVAFSYRRTEIGGSETNDVPANSVGARATLNLVSPVESVEAVFAADRAAGGAPPESDERVVRFGMSRLRHRRRAVTARDFEDLALESSPDIVQARCFVRPGVVRLVVVMRGEDPLPDAAEVRELRSLLLEVAPAALGDALQIEGPRLRRLRILLRLRVATLDHAGEVAKDVQERIAKLFDTQAWPLGANPSEEDIALALIDTRHLESLATVSLREVLPDGTERPWNGGLQPADLVLLDKDPIRLQFETVEVIA
ncbi:MAG TPA: baseplate J/gp47 family protein [Thermoanaerobaculia bacterium]|nr:baseplate J/gp47 family protein [Thermoanaerobaculia bacterium]